MTKAFSRNRGFDADARQTRRPAIRQGERDDWRPDDEEAGGPYGGAESRDDPPGEEPHGSGPSGGRRRDEQQPRGSRDEPERAASLDAEVIVENAMENAAALIEQRVAASERQTAKALEKVAALIEGRRRTSDGKEMEKAVAALEQRARASERKTAEALSGITNLIETKTRKPEGLDILADRLQRIESRLAQSSAETGRPIRNVLTRLERRVETLSKQDRTLEFRQALDGLDRRLAELSSRLHDDRARPGPLAPASSHAAMEQGLQPYEDRPIATAIAEIRRRMQARSEVAHDEARRSVEPEPAEAIAQITRRLEALDDVEPAEPFAENAVAPVFDPRRVDELQQSIESISRQLQEDAGEREERQRDLSRQLEALRGDAGEQLERQRELSGQIEALREDAGERAEQHSALSGQMEGLRHDLDVVAATLGGLAPRAALGSIEAALRELAERVEAQRNRGVDERLLLPVERLAAELTGLVKDLDPSAQVKELRADIKAMAQRLDDMQSPAAGNDALDEIWRQSADIKELLTTLAARPLPLERLEARLLDLTQCVDALSLAATANGAGDLGAAVTSIRAIVASETGNSYRALKQRLEQLGGKLEEALAKSAAKRFDELGQRMEKMHKSLAERIETTASARRQSDAAALENLVAKLAKKIDAALEQKPAGLAELGRKIDKLQSRVDDPATASALARVEAILAKSGQDERFSNLSERLDQVQKTLAGHIAKGGPDLRPVAETLRRLEEKFEAALRPESGRAEIAALESQLGQMSEKLDRAVEGAAEIKAALTRAPQNRQLGELAQRIDFVHRELAARIDAGGKARADRSQAQLSGLAERIDSVHKEIAARIEAGADSRAESNKAQLAQLVEQLARKIDTALDPKSGSAALQALEAQIQQLSARLERSGDANDALKAVERNVSALFERIDEARATSAEAAEAAVRRATQEILREAAAAKPGALNAEIERELASLRESQDERGQRTQETLAAVHKTLERVVDRLASFEDELEDIRRGAVAREVARPTLVTTGGLRGAGPLGQGPVPTQKAAAPFPAGEPRAPQSASVQSDFIAAARRAAQQAAADAHAAEQARDERRRARSQTEADAEALGVAEGEEKKPFELKAVGMAIQARKRPLLLGLGAMVMLAGAYEAARMTIDEPGRRGQLALSEPEQATASAGPAEVAALEASRTASHKNAPQQQAAGAASQSSPSPFAPEPSPSGPATKFQAANVDPAPVGSIDRSAADALDGLSRLAAQGDAAAQLELGVRYADGRGVAKDGRMAAQWLESAAAQGLALAQYRLGSLYEKGVGVDRDFAKAYQWYERAAEAGNARAMHNLAVLAASGQDGKVDFATAAQWFRKAAELGVRDSQYNLGVLYALGRGVIQSFTTSFMWFSVAAEQGDAAAATKRDEVGARLDSKELATARAMVDSYKPQTPNREANEAPPLKKGGDAKPLGKPKISRL